MNKRTLSFRPIALALAFAGVMASGPAAAQRASLAERVAALEQRAANNQGNVDLLNQVNQLKAEVAQLRAQIEELQQQNSQAQSTSRAQYLDLDGRLNRLEGGAPAASGQGGEPAANVAPPVTTPSGAAAAPAAPPAADERASYEAAFDTLKSGQYDASARAFNQFLQRYPNGSYAPNARYWLGESYYVTQNYELELEQFKTLYQQYPNHDKAPGALLKIGLSQYGLKRMDDARVTLDEVARKYPGSDAARTADDRLRAIDLSVR
ncbi:MAG: tol-pal system protein YbgF [Pseudoxanthomonas sp.]|nr:tol-pal system protein YbgF [Pseudoxanthomonas sp.]